MHHIIAYIEAENRNRIGNRYPDDIRSWFHDALSQNFSNSDVRLLLQYLAEGNDQAVGTMIEAALVKEYGDAAKEFERLRKERAA